MEPLAAVTSTITDGAHGRSGRNFGLWAAALFMLLQAGMPGIEAARAEEPSRAALDLPGIVDVAGFLQTRNYIGTASPLADEYQFHNDFRLASHLDLGAAGTGVLSLQQRLYYNDSDEGGFYTERTTFQLWEAWSDTQWGRTSIRTGRQLIRWGKADEVNPIDNFTPEDYREFINLERADRKLPVLAVDARRPLSGAVRGELLWLPFFEPNKISEADEQWEFYFQRAYRDAFDLTQIENDEPARNLNSSVYAGRLQWEGDDADVGLSYAYHYDQNPMYYVQAPDDSSPLPFVTGEYKRLHSAGAEFESTYGQVGLRGEAVYTLQRPFITLDEHDADRVETKDYFSSVVGADYTTPHDIYLNLQFTQDYIVGRAPHMFNHSYEPSFTYRVWRKFFHEQVKLQITGRRYLGFSDYFGKFDVMYQPFDDWEFSAGAIWFGGPRDRVFGQFGGNDQLFLTARYFL